MNVASLVERLARGAAAAGVSRARVLLITPEGTVRIALLPSACNPLRSERIPPLTRLIVTPPPYGEIRIEPGLLLAFGGGEPNPLAAWMVRSAGEPTAIRGAALVMRLRADGIADLSDQELLWLQARLDGLPPVGAPRTGLSAASIWTAER